MKSILDFIHNHPVLEQVLWLLLSIVIAFVIVLILLKVSRRVFKKLQARTNKKNINMRVAENGLRFLIIFVAVLWVIMSSNLTRSFGQTIFTGTTVLAAIAGFAAQPVLSDLICGLIIGSTKPIEIGNRITLDSGISGIVKDITLRHVVLQGLDTQTYIIPNSKMNSYVINNMSYHSDIRSADFRFATSYRTDPEQAAQIIEEAIRSSEYSVPGKIGAQGQKEYARVYFLSFSESSLSFGTTAYFESSTPTEVFKHDINTRVKRALEAHQIEIPYNYLNVVMQNKNP